jgi:DNA polymerase IV (archaeal DinB-like DNA polymerase)
MSDQIILHLDMDSFFASIEIRDNPTLKGRPVVIGADPVKGKGRGVVSTCSYEARKFGIHSAMPISKAYNLCPDAIFLPPLISKYRNISEKIMNLLATVTKNIEQVSVDEAFIDISFCNTYYMAEKFAEYIKRLIYNSENLSCSIGVAPSRTYAKIASELQKPDGLVVIPPFQIISCITPLPVETIPGIGKKALEILHNIGIITIGDLADANIQKLQDTFGSRAVKIKSIALGEDREGLHPPKLPRSIGRDYTFQKDESDPEILKEHLKEMVYQIQTELKQNNLFSRTISIRIRYKKFNTTTKSISRDHPTQDINQIYDMIIRLFYDSWNGESVRLIGMRCSGLFIHHADQSTLQDFL